MVRIIFPDSGKQKKKTMRKKFFLEVENENKERKKMFLEVKIEKVEKINFLYYI